MVAADNVDTSVRIREDDEPISPAALRVSPAAVIVAPATVLVMAPDAVRLMLPAAEIFALATMSEPTPVVVTFKFGAVMFAKFVAVNVEPTVRSKRDPAVEPARTTPEVSVMKTFAPGVFADRLTTSVNIRLPPEPMSPTATRFSVFAEMMAPATVRDIAPAALRLMVPLAEKLEFVMMSEPAPFVVMFMFGAEIVAAPPVLSVAPAVMSKRLPADEARILTPESSET